MVDFVYAWNGASDFDIFHAGTSTAGRAWYARRINELFFSVCVMHSFRQASGDGAREWKRQKQNGIRSNRFALRAQSNLNLNDCEMMRKYYAKISFIVS